MNSNSNWRNIFFLLPLWFPIKKYYKKLHIAIHPMNFISLLMWTRIQSEDFIASSIGLFCLFRMSPLTISTLPSIEVSLEYNVGINTVYTGQNATSICLFIQLLSVENLDSFFTLHNKTLQDTESWRKLFLHIVVFSSWILTKHFSCYTHQSSPGVFSVHSLQFFSPRIFFFN